LHVGEVQTHGLDKYGRTIADVLLPDGTHVNHTLVKNGWYQGIEVGRTRETERLVGRSSAGTAVGVAEENTELLLLICSLKSEARGHQWKSIHGGQRGACDFKKRISPRRIIGVPKYLRSIYRCFARVKDSLCGWLDLAVKSNHVIEHNKTFPRVNQ
jgi:hypothetical protein